MKMKHLLTFVCLFVSTLLLSGCGEATPSVTAEATGINSVPQSASQVIAEGKLLPAQHMELSFASGSRVAEVLVSNGELVEAGQLLALLEGSELYTAQEATANLLKQQSELALQTLEEKSFPAIIAAAANLETAQKAYEDAARTWRYDSRTADRFDTTIDEYILAEKAVQEAQKELDDKNDLAENAPARVQAANNLKREEKRRTEAYQDMLPDFEYPQSGQDNTERTLLVAAITQLEDARLQASKMQNGPDTDQKALLETQLESAVQSTAAAQAMLKMLELRAPFAGQLIQWDVQPGETIAAGSMVGAIAEPTEWLVETSDLTENSISQVAVGDSVAMTVDALPGETFTGTVEWIDGYGMKWQGDITYRVRVKLDGSDPRWYWNMTTTVTIEK
jgi:multidrug resistance efflux pump